MLPIGKNLTFHDKKKIKSTTAVNAINHWQYVEPFAKVPEKRSEYLKQRTLLDELINLSFQKKINILII